MTLRFILGGTCLGLAALACCSGSAQAKSCTYDWAIPGVYLISGNFRGKIESTDVRLTNDCRVIMRIPGVLTGGGLSKAGECLKFAFKISGEKRAFFARWCNTYGIVPWNGRDIRATVTRRSVAKEEGPQPKFNFNSGPPEKQSGVQ